MIHSFIFFRERGEGPKGMRAGHARRAKAVMILCQKKKKWGLTIFLLLVLKGSILHIVCFSLHIHKWNEILRPHHHVKVTQSFLSIPSEEDSFSSSVGGVFPPIPILHQDKHCAVVSKPPSVVCHHSYYTGSKGSRKTKNKNYKQPEIPVLQRVQHALGTKVNLVHRIDRGASGCLIVSFPENTTTTIITSRKGPTTQLMEALQSPNATKTYVALVRGAGTLRGENLIDKGWFLVDRPIQDERGVWNNATTVFRFVSGYYNVSSGARASLVLAKPRTGRWHQIRRHLNGLSHPILGDTLHGSSPINRQWREQFDLSEERLCLHLARIVLPETDYTQPLDVCCPLANDLVTMIRKHIPQVLEQSRPVLEKEGIIIDEEC